jgi:hypothetical protein
MLKYVGNPPVSALDGVQYKSASTLSSAVDTFSITNPRDALICHWVPLSFTDGLNGAGIFRILLFLPCCGFLSRNAWIAPRIEFAHFAVMLSPALTTSGKVI